MGLLDAFKQYLRDAAPGGVLNPEVPKDTPVLGLLADPIGNIRSTLNKSNAEADARLKLLAAAEKDTRRTGKFFGTPAQDAYQSQLNDFVVNSLGPLATVWHGSPHKFDKFDASKIGTGEGAQAYGHGLYLAESPAVAEDYATKLGGLAVKDASGNKFINYGDHDIPISYLKKFAKEADPFASAEKAMREKIVSGNADDVYGLANGVKQLRALKEKGFSIQDDGSLYKVDLPDDAIAKMLDWDKPLSQQPQAVRDIASSVFANEPRYDPAYTRGLDLYHAMNAGNGPKASTKVSDAMREAGIPGIRYLDGGSRGTGAGTSNFVVFPGNEGLLTILERNGQKINDAPGLLKPKFVYPQEQALLTAQKNAALPVEQGGLGLRPDNTPMERAKALGFDIDFNHGTQRLDRLLEKKAFDPKRATSGPMPYGTDNVDIASNYAGSKADTSRVANDTGDIRNYFQVAPKDIGLSGRSPYSVEQSWHFLKPEVKADILDKAKRVGYENLDDFTGNFALHPQGTDATLNGDHFDWLMKQNRNNPLAAMREMWHDSGQLVDSPEALADIYKLAGYPAPISQSNAPWFTANGVFTGKARMTNPLDTSNKEELTSKVIPALREAFKGDRTRLKPYGADAWDKTSLFTPKTWVDQLQNDINGGYNSSAWTSIPDKVTAQLKSLGYDGILDTGGKNGGIGHQVAIPFSPNQVRSDFAAFDPKRVNDADLLGGATPQLLGLLAGGAGAGVAGYNWLTDL